MQFLGSVIFIPHTQNIQSTNAGNAGAAIVFSATANIAVSLYIRMPCKNYLAIRVILNSASAAR